MTYSYDNANRLTAQTVAGSSVTSYTYDNANRLIEVTAPMNGGALDTTYTYDNANRLLTTTLPNGNVETKSYDATSKDLTSVIVQNTGSTVLSSQTYTYDGMGRRDTETLPGSISIDYDYDDAGQLVDETRTGSGSYSIQYTYDNAGNRLTKVLNSVTESYTYDDANKLTAAGNKTYTYNGAGGIATVSVSGSTVSTLTWDVEGRLASVASGGSTKYNTYNGIGQRVGKATGGTPTAAYTLADDRIDSPVIADGSATYHQGPNGLIGETRSSTDKYYHPDALGTTRAITNSGGSVTDTLTTDAFGLPVSTTGSTPTPFGFAGQHGYQSDFETGLMRLGHRYYDSSIGRFISRDPIHDGYNWYRYCNNDPVNGVDPTGLDVGWARSDWPYADPYGNKKKNPPSARVPPPAPVLGETPPGNNNWGTAPKRPPINWGTAPKNPGIPGGGGPSGPGGGGPVVPGGGQPDDGWGPGYGLPEYPPPRKKPQLALLRVFCQGSFK